MRKFIQNPLEEPFPVDVSSASAPPAKDMRKIQSIFLGFLLIFGCLSGVELPERIKHFSLDNGMNFYILPCPGTKVFTGITGVKAGSASERPGEEGIAHFLEHLCCKTVPSLNTVKGAGNKNGELIAQLYASRGGRNSNALTDADTTQYHVSLPADALEFWFQVEAQRLKDLKINDLKRERDVVFEEWMQSIGSNPAGGLIDAFTKKAYPNHPYGHSVLGEPSDIRLFNIEKAMAFFKKNYIPGNMVAVLVGDVEKNNVHKLAAHFFGTIPAAKTAHPHKSDKAKPLLINQIKEERVVIQSKSESLLLIGYRIPSYPSRDHLITLLIMEILSGSNSARLDRELVFQKKMVSQINCFLDFPGGKFPSLFMMEIVPFPSYKTGEIESVIFNHLERLKNEPVSEKEIQTAILHYEVQLYKSLDGHLPTAQAIFKGAALYDDPGANFKKLELIKNVTAAEIKNTAAKVFKDSNRIVGVLKPGSGQGGPS